LSCLFLARYRVNKGATLRIRIKKEREIKSYRSLGRSILSKEGKESD
jgi:hypothetical protein